MSSHERVDEIRHLIHVCVSGLVSPFAVAIALNMRDERFAAILSRVIEPTEGERTAIRELIADYKHAITGVNARWRGSMVETQHVQPGDRALELRENILATMTEEEREEYLQSRVDRI